MRKHQKINAGTGEVEGVPFTAAEETARDADESAWAADASPRRKRRQLETLSGEGLWTILKAKGVVTDVDLP